jgi:hypothetical protein
MDITLLAYFRKAPLCAHRAPVAALLAELISLQTASAHSASFGPGFVAAPRAAAVLVDGALPDSASMAAGAPIDQIGFVL